MNKLMFGAKLIAFSAFALASLIAPAGAQVANGKVTSAAPTYVDGSANGLSLDTSGNLRVLAGGSGGTASQVQGNSASGAADVGNPVKVGCRFNNTTPTLTDGQRVDCQANSSGFPGIIVGTKLTTGADGVANNTLGSTFNAEGNNFNTATLLRQAPFVFNGTSWDRQRGDTNGAFVQGNVAVGATGTSNPLLVGCITNQSSAVTSVSNGQRSTCRATVSGDPLTLMGGYGVSGNDGSVGIVFLPDANNPTLNGSLRMLGVAPYVFNGASFDRNFTCPNSAIVNVTAGTTAQIVPLVAAQTIRVCSYAVTASANGTFQFVTGTGANCGTGTTNLTGAMAIAANDNNDLSSGNGSLFRSLSANALCLTAVGGNMTGFISFAQY